ncbi:hypothetical protein [Halomonas sp. I5-271120]|uniref:hypothetical protein n=1 Tax=Halomonas sp. I5-271120 TaxID=3061632 RepID=UPI002714BDC9|nr:hypothetical protein [Halomonas sp. I5-271120]
MIQLTEADNMTPAPVLQHSPEGVRIQQHAIQPARGRELDLRYRDWPGLDVETLALQVAAAWSSPLTASLESPHRLVPGEARQGRRGCVGHILDGLRADLLFERKHRSGQLKTYCYPVLFVDRVLGGSHRQFRINQQQPLGLAYAKAIAHYAKIRGLDKDEIGTALSRAPHRGLFLDVMTHRTSQGYSIPRERVMAKLGVATAGLEDVSAA